MRHGLCTPAQKSAAVVEGDNHGGSFQALREPGEGDGAPAMSGSGGGRAYLPDSAKTADELHLVRGKWRFKGGKDYDYVTCA